MECLPIWPPQSLQNHLFMKEFNGTKFLKPRTHATAHNETRELVAKNKNDEKPLQRKAPLTLNAISPCPPLGFPEKDLVLFLQIFLDIRKKLRLVSRVESILTEWLASGGGFKLVAGSPGISPSPYGDGVRKRGKKSPENIGRSAFKRFQ